MRLKAVFSKNCNYIYHMLSVSKCGYDNEYGNKYRAYHAETDLQILKRCEKLITIKGGEHIGELYGFLTMPALFEDNVPLDSYVEAVIDMLENDDSEKNLEKYKPIYESAFPGVIINADSQKEFYNMFPSDKKEIVDIYKVLHNNYGIYNDKIWKTSKEELAVAVDELNKRLSEKDYVSEWEKILDCKYKHDNFYAVICNSLKGGPQCIDISYNKDVFNIPDNYSSAVQLINHEFGIYLLIEILSETQAFKDLAYYKLTESLAEYFNVIVSGGHEFNWFKEHQDFYKELRNKNPKITLKEMFLQAKERA